MRKWGGLFLGYLLEKNFRRRDRDHLVPRRMDAAVCRADVCYPFRRKHGRHRAVRRREFNNVARRRGCRVAARGARAAVPKVADHRFFGHDLAIGLEHLDRRIRPSSE